MAEVDIRLALEGGEADRDGRRYQPGSTVSGTVQLVAHDDFRCDRVFLTLGWHTEGRGDRNSARIDEVELLSGPLTADTSLSQGFVFTLPSQPWSYAGHYITIIWEITVTIAVRFAPDINQTEQIVVAPRRVAAPAG